MPTDPIGRAIDGMDDDGAASSDEEAPQFWRRHFERNVPDQAPPSKLVDRAVRAKINRHSRRLAVIIAKRTMRRFRGRIPNAMPAKKHGPGKKRGHPSVAFLAAEIVCLLNLNANERLGWRPTRIDWLATPDGGDPQEDDSDKARDALEAEDGYKGDALPRIPTRLAIQLGFTAGEVLTTNMLREAERTFGLLFDEFVPVLLNELIKMAMKLIDGFGQHLVADGTYFASIAHTKHSKWARDGYIQDKAAFRKLLEQTPIMRWAQYASVGHCHHSFEPKLPPRKKRKGNKQSPDEVRLPAGDDGEKSGRRHEDCSYMGRQVMLVLDGPSTLPVVIFLAPANLPEDEVFIRGVLPELRRVILETKIHPITLSADMGFDWNKVAKAIHEFRVGSVRIDPRIDLVDRENRFVDHEVQDGDVDISFRVRGDLARRLGHVLRDTDNDGAPLDEPELVIVWQRLPVIRRDDDRMRLGFGCAPPDEERLAQLTSPEKARQARLFHACGAPNTGDREHACRAGKDGVLYWMRAAGANLDRTIITRPPPASGRPIQPHEILRVEVGTEVTNSSWLHERRYEGQAGLYRGQLSCRDDPNVLADFRALRSRIENKNAALRQYMSLTVARAWKHIAAWQGYLSVLTRMVLALSNVYRLALRGKVLGIANNVLQPLLCLIAGYIVERDRVKSTSPP